MLHIQGDNLLIGTVFDMKNYSQDKEMIGVIILF